ncbi:hypothetical protein [Mesorhizobium sp.]|uniref:hypothetical protein n=1 Tax=Mesorhizobium sp. TaxID=1871066 RepID=UPI0025F38560|nr:hypothetical protein [Mesorhizobium sp.]
MKPTTVDVNSPDYLAVQETVTRERHEITRTADKMLERLRGLSPVSQKQAICQMTAIWVMANYPRDKETQLSLSDAIREQTDMYLKGDGKLPSNHH